MNFQLALEIDPDDLELSSNNTLFTRNFSESARLGFEAFQVKDSMSSKPILKGCVKSLGNQNTEFLNLFTHLHKYTC